MDEKCEKALLVAIHQIAATFGPRAVLKGGMALRLQGIPRSTMDADFTFKPYKNKTSFSEQLVLVLNKICDQEVAHMSDSKKIQIRGQIQGVEILIEASAQDYDFDPEPINTTELSRRHNLPSAIISIMPNAMAFAHKCGAWYDRRLARDLYDLYIFYDILKTTPDREILLMRLQKPNFTKLVKIKPRLMNIDDFVNFLREESQKKGSLKIESELEGILEERERVGVGHRILTILQRMVITA